MTLENGIEYVYAVEESQNVNPVSYTHLAGILILGMIVAAAAPLFERMQALFAQTGAKAEYVQVLFKSLGLCFITQIACDACRDLGESAIASKVEAAGKISVLLISLPLFEQILNIASGLIGQ